MYHRLVTERCVCMTFQFLFIHPVRSFVEMTKILLSQDGSFYLLSERFSQDPLENYFRQQRIRGRRSDNPSVKEVVQNAMAIRAQKSLQLDRVRGNCRRKRLLSKLSIAKLTDITLHYLKPNVSVHQKTNQIAFL